jgi:hypothetical protein
LIEIAARQGYELTVADIEMLLRHNQEQAQLHSDEFDDDELSEQELELVAGGGKCQILGVLESATVPVGGIANK